MSSNGEASLDLSAKKDKCDKGKKITVLRLGLQYESSMLLIEYTNSNINANSEKSADLRYRKIKLERGDSSEISNSLLKKFPEYFEKVPISIMLNLLSTFPGRKTPSFTKDSLQTENGSREDNQEQILNLSEPEKKKPHESIYGDLNKVSDGALQRAKENMDKLFVSNSVRPGDREYKFDVRVDFKGPESDSSWD
jgi:hypothetical protein